MLALWLVPGTAGSIALLALSRRLRLRPWSVPASLLVGYGWPVWLVGGVVWGASRAARGKPIF